MTSQHSTFILLLVAAAAVVGLKESFLSNDTTKTTTTSRQASKQASKSASKKVVDGARKSFHFAFVSLLQHSTNKIL